MPLNDIFIKKLKPQKKQGKFSDSGGLFLLVSPSGGKWWRLKYRFAGKEKSISLGTYPTIALKEARSLRDEAKKLLAKGIDPGEVKKAKKSTLLAEKENCFEQIAREWHNKNTPKWVPKHGERILIRLEKDIFPLIGDRPIETIKAPELLKALRNIEVRGAYETAHRTLQSCGQIFRYAIATGRAERDIAADLKDALSPAQSKNFASIKDPKEISFLLKNIEVYDGGLVVRTALRIAPYVFVRPGELRHAQWDEFDFEKQEWRIPAKKMKMRQVHIVPLAQQVMTILKELQPFTGHTEYLFPSMRSICRPISDVTLLAGLRRMGYTKEQMTVHGFRSMASTLLNEKGYNRDWIERQLAHGERNTIRAAYNYAEYLQERRCMMQEWADYLDNLKSRV